MDKAAVVVNALLCLGITFSGCVGSEGGILQASEGPGSPAVPDAAGPARFDETTGAIQGTVTDDQVQPIPGAQVGVAGQDLVTIADVGGNFAFSNLQPGRYALNAIMLGYNAAARSVEVKAGEVSQVGFALTPLPVAKPYTEVFPFTGLIECGVAVIRTTLSLGCDPNEAGATNHDIYPDGWPIDWNATVVEGVWDSQANPDWLAFDYNDRSLPDPYYGVYYRFRGTSPMWFLIDRCADYQSTNFGRAPVPCTDEAVNASKTHLEAFYGGKLQPQTHALDAVCQINITNPQGGGNIVSGYQQGCYGVGPALDIRYQLYVSVFHMERPGDIETYSARPDG